MRFSIIVPVYNRPAELKELLESLTYQKFSDFEVIIVEDGSTISSKEVVDQYAGKLTIRYFLKLNSGPGPTRNFGYERAAGAYLVSFDSDCIIPPNYFTAVNEALAHTPLDAWGGPDRGNASFTPIQQAMAYTMSATLTTGGIRGGASTGFQPRSFNMGISRHVYEQTGGFKFTRLAEDIELSIRMKNAGFRVGLIPEAWVFHKRRTNLREFFRQVSGFGKGRIQVGRAHPGAVKLTHWLPALFFAGQFVIPFTLFLSFSLTMVLTAGYFFYLILIGIGAFLQTGSGKVGWLAIPAAYVQLNGYGSGFLKEMFRRGV